MALIVKNPPANAEDIETGSGRSPGGGHDNLLQYSYLENLMDRGAWRAIVHRVVESDMTEHTHTHTHIFFCSFNRYLFIEYLHTRLPC